MSEKNLINEARKNLDKSEKSSIADIAKKYALIAIGQSLVTIAEELVKQRKQREWDLVSEDSVI